MKMQITWLSFKSTKFLLCSRFLEDETSSYITRIYTAYENANSPILT